jgi:hypothetical protein
MSNLRHLLGGCETIALLPFDSTFVDPKKQDLKGLSQSRQ